MNINISSNQKNIIETDFLAPNTRIPIYNVKLILSKSKIELTLKTINFWRLAISVIYISLYAIITFSKNKI